LENYEFRTKCLFFFLCVLKQTIKRDKTARFFFMKKMARGGEVRATEAGIKGCRDKKKAKGEKQDRLRRTRKDLKRCQLQEKRLLGNGQETPGPKGGKPKGCCTVRKLGAGQGSTKIVSHKLGKRVLEEPPPQLARKRVGRKTTEDVPSWETYSQTTNGSDWAHQKGTARLCGGGWTLQLGQKELKL